MTVDQDGQTAQRIGQCLEALRRHTGLLPGSDDRLGPLQRTIDELEQAVTVLVARNAQLAPQIAAPGPKTTSQVDQHTAALETAYQQLELLERHKSDFIQVVSHELRTPLTIIQGHGQLLLKDLACSENESTAAQIRAIVAAATRLHEIVDNMLDTAQIDTNTMGLVMGHVVLSDVFDTLYRELAPALDERRLTLTVQEMVVPPIEADVRAMHKLFEHLLLNAVKYTPDGGRITISGRLLGRLARNPSEQFVEIVVSDTGIGIAPEFHELIFSKFYQTGPSEFHSSGKTKFKGGGPGLGLTIARGIVEAHGGRIWVESPGYDETTCPGSQFHLVLPVARARVEFAAC